MPRSYVTIDKHGPVAVVRFGPARAKRIMLMGESQLTASFEAARIARERFGKR